MLNAKYAWMLLDVDYKAELVGVDDLDVAEHALRRERAAQTGPGPWECLAGRRSKICHLVAPHLRAEFEKATASASAEVPRFWQISDSAPLQVPPRTAFSACHPLPRSRAPCNTHCSTSCSLSVNLVSEPLSHHIGEARRTRSPPNWCPKSLAARTPEHPFSGWFSTNTTPTDNDNAHLISLRYMGHTRRKNVRQAPQSE